MSFQFLPSADGKTQTGVASLPAASNGAAKGAGFDGNTFDSLFAESDTPEFLVPAQNLAAGFPSEIPPPQPVENFAAPTALGVGDFARDSQERPAKISRSQGPDTSPNIPSARLQPGASDLDVGLTSLPILEDGSLLPVIAPARAFHAAQFREDSNATGSGSPAPDIIELSQATKAEPVRTSEFATQSVPPPDTPAPADTAPTRNVEPIGPIVSRTDFEERTPEVSRKDGANRNTTDRAPPAQTGSQTLAPSARSETQATDRSPATPETPTSAASQQATRPEQTSLPQSAGPAESPIERTPVSGYALPEGLVTSQKQSSVAPVRTQAAFLEPPNSSGLTGSSAKEPIPPTATIRMPETEVTSSSGNEARSANAATALGQYVIESKNHSAQSSLGRAEQLPVPSPASPPPTPQSQNMQSPQSPPAPPPTSPLPFKGTPQDVKITLRPLTAEPIRASEGQPGNRAPEAATRIAAPTASLPAPAATAATNTSAGPQAPGTTLETIARDGGLEFPLSDLGRVTAVSGPVASAPTQLEAPGRLPILQPQVMAQLAEMAPELRSGPVEIQLSPEELGRVRMALSASEASVQIQITTERPETQDLIRRHLDMLSDDLRRQGFSDISFSFANGEDADGWNGESSPRPNASADSDFGEAGDRPGPTKSLTIPASSRLDIRI